MTGSLSGRSIRRLLWLSSALLGLLALVVIAYSQFGARPLSFPRTFPEVGIVLLDRSVSDVAWSRDGRWIAYAKRNPKDWYMDVWKIRPDGSDAQCLTEGTAAPKKHCGGPTWHPSGKYIVFVAANEDVQTKRAEKLAEPGSGINTNLWAMTVDGKWFWKLTDHKTDYLRPRGAIHPQFSHDGKRIFWAGPTGNFDFKKGYEWGEWALFIADFSLHPDGTPSLQNIEQFQPGEQHSFYESHDWSPDDQKVLFCANLQPGHSVNQLEIYEYELSGKRLKRLTYTKDDWDEHAHYSPDGKKILWISGAELKVKFLSLQAPQWAKYVKTELWIMDADGTNPCRLTYFNQPGHPDYEWFQKAVFPTKRVIVSDSAFSPDGKKAVICIAYEAPIVGINSVLAVMDLEKRQQKLQGMPKGQ